VIVRRCVSAAVAILVFCGARLPVRPVAPVAGEARIQAASASGKPVRLRVDENAGRGIGDSLEARYDELADVFDFGVWQEGLAADGAPRESLQRSRPDPAKAPA
jgi:hypothetical protein